MINSKNSVRGEKILVNVDITLQAPHVGGWETADGSGAPVDGFGSRGVGSGGGDCAFRFVSGRGGRPFKSSVELQCFCWTLFDFAAPLG